MNVRNLQPWLQFGTHLMAIIAQRGGRAPREIAYLQLLTNTVALAAMTDEDLTQLRAKYAHNKH